MGDLIRSKKTKARKDHKCDWCDGLIPKGEIYDCNTLVGENGFYVWRSCKRCPEYVAKAFREDFCNAQIDGLTQDGFREYMQNGYKEVLERWDKENEGHQI